MYVKAQILTAFIKVKVTNGEFNRQKMGFLLSCPASLFKMARHSAGEGLLATGSPLNWADERTASTFLTKKGRFTGSCICRRPQTPSGVYFCVHECVCVCVFLLKMFWGCQKNHSFSPLNFENCVISEKFDPCVLDSFALNHENLSAKGYFLSQKMLVPFLISPINALPPRPPSPSAEGWVWPKENQPDHRGHGSDLKCQTHEFWPRFGNGQMTAHLHVRERSGMGRGGAARVNGRKRVIYVIL